MENIQKDTYLPNNVIVYKKKIKTTDFLNFQVTSTLTIWFI